MFQSTRPRGARQYELLLLPAGKGFNPRARVGRDLVIKCEEDFVMVSIHAPAWGATAFFQSYLFDYVCFNPRARVGRDVVVFVTALNHGFQSTRPRGARRLGGAGALVFKCFNPRARVGRDDIGYGQCNSRRVSIHAPAWGATGLSTFCQ